MNHNLTFRRAKKKIIHPLARPTLPSLLFLSDFERVKNPQEVINTLPKRCGVVIRDYNNPKRNELINQTIKNTKNTGRAVFISCLARAHGGYQGEHWPQAGRAGQRKISRHQLITSSAHNLGEVGRVNRLKVDGMLISPLFNTPSHPNREALNIHRFVRLARLAKPRVYALGGVNKNSIKQLSNIKTCFGIAGIGLFK